MNPSAKGWIDKFGSLADMHNNLPVEEGEYYRYFRDLGFMYGTNISILPGLPAPVLISEEEKAKLNLLGALYGMYRVYSVKPGDFNDFLHHLSVFYQLVQIESFSFLDRILTTRKTSHQLESLLHQRVTLNDNVISKAFNQMLTNSMLFTDVLNFKKYLEGDRNIQANGARMEQLIIHLGYHLVKSRTSGGAHSERLLKQLHASSRYADTQVKKEGTDYLQHVLTAENSLENRYLFDLACLISWDATPWTEENRRLLLQTGKELHLDTHHIEEAMGHAGAFFTANREQLRFLQDTHPLKLLYDNSQLMVKKLILRNRIRLMKEISESKELLFLLKKAAVTDLDPKEKQRLKTQLIDLFKTIPSLAIFALPGGAILLPVFISMIPNLLPSAFDDNKVDAPSK